MSMLSAWRKLGLDVEVDSEYTICRSKIDEAVCTWFICADFGLR
jgi:hypothetical protein